MFSCERRYLLAPGRLSEKNKKKKSKWPNAAETDLIPVTKFEKKVLHIK